MLTCQNNSRSPHSPAHSLPPLLRLHKPVRTAASFAREIRDEQEALTLPLRFEFHHPTAQHVCVAGSFNDWNLLATPLVNLGGGR